MASVLITQIEAVNIMLKGIGETPVNSLDTSVNATAELALLTLSAISKEFQMSGWHFNTEKEWQLTRNGDNELILDDNTVSVDVDENLYPYLDVDQRGNKVYDRKNHTTVWTQDLKVTIVRILDWNDLPQAARWLITTRAARQFQQDQVGSEESDKFQQERESAAKTLFDEYDSSVADYNIFNSYSAWRVVRR